MALRAPGVAGIRPRQKSSDARYQKLRHDKICRLCDSFGICGAALDETAGFFLTLRSFAEGVKEMRVVVVQRVAEGDAVLGLAQAGLGEPALVGHLNPPGEGIAVLFPDEVVAHRDGLVRMEV